MNGHDFQFEEFGIAKPKILIFCMVLLLNSFTYFLKYLKVSVSF